MPGLDITHADEDQPGVVLVDEFIDSDHFMFEGIEPRLNKKGEIEPLFSVSEVAKFFFARSPHWLRWNENEGRLVIDGIEVEVQRTEPTSVDQPGQRRYELADVERIAHALASQGFITSSQLRITLHLLRVEGRLWQYLP